MAASPAADTCRMLSISWSREGKMCLRFTIVSGDTTDKLTRMEKTPQKLHNDRLLMDVRLLF